MYVFVYALCLLVADSTYVVNKDEYIALICFNLLLLIVGLL